MEYRNGFERGQQDAREGISLPSWKLSGYPTAYAHGYADGQEA